jgi:RNA polymerase sigma-70 factor (ECF subfamily)
MEARTPRLEPEALLAHAGWLRQLAASLVADPAGADGVVQDTWLAALRHPPAGDRPLGPWLARVARNFALRRRRGELRRAEHERGLAAPGAAPTPEQTVERLDLQRTLVEAVQAVGEPFRTAIVQRYFEGRSGAEIARLSGVPAGTVRWRIKRGIEELRERLDGRFGSRASWCALLVPLARRTSGLGAPSLTASEILTGVLAMNVMQASAVAAGLVLVAGGLWWSLAGREPVPAEAGSARAARAPTPPVRMGAPAAEEDMEALDRLGPGESPTRAALEPAASPEPRAVPAAPAARTAAVEVRFIDAAGAPWSDVRFEPRGEPPQFAPWGPATTSASDGRARLELVFPELPEGVSEPERFDARQLELVASRGGCAPAGLSAVVRVGETTHLGDVVLRSGVRLCGRVLDEQGRGVAGATLGLAPVELPPEEDGRLRRHGSDAFGRVPGTASSADGTFVLDGAGAGTWRLWTHAEGMRYAWSDPIAVTAASRTYSSIDEAEPIEWSCTVGAGQTTHHDLDLTVK